MLINSIPSITDNEGRKGRQFVENLFKILIKLKLNLNEKS
jgi:hypothetical protein